MSSILRRGVLIITVLYAVADSADTSAVHFYHNQTGISLGLPIATGLSYRTWLSDKYGIQFSGLYFAYNTENRGYIIGTDNFRVLSFGVMGLYNFSRWKHGRIFYFAGIGYFEIGTVYHKKILIDSTYYNYDMSNDRKTTLPLCNGFGVDWTLCRINFDIMAGLGVGYSVTNNEFILPVGMVAIGISYCY